MRWLAQCVEKGMQVGVNSCKFRTKCYIVYSITRPKLILSPQKRVSIYHTKLYILLQEAQLMEENQRLKQVISLFVVSFFCFFLFMYDISLLIKKKNVSSQMENLFSVQTHVLEQGQSSESVTNICSLSDPPQDNDSSKTSLRLG